MYLKIKKVTDKVDLDLDVKAQGCGDDCTYWKTVSQKYVDAGVGEYCKKVTDSRWTSWW
jgi:hypothetical protein